MTVMQDNMRKVLGARASSVAVITSVDSEGQPRGLTCTAFCSVSIDPPMLLVCIDKGSETLPALAHTEAFVVNILAAGREEVSNRFASKEKDKFQGIEWQPSRHAKGSPILVQDALAYAECTVAQAIEAGDHWVFIGYIIGGSAHQEVGPLLYFRRSYGAWPQPDPNQDN